MKFACKRTIAFSLGIATAASAASFHVNNAGYETSGPKSLVVESSANLEGAEYKFLLGGSTVLKGTFSAPKNPGNWVSSAVYYNIDFSKISKAGEYTLSFSEAGKQVSTTINVIDNAMALDPLSLVLKYFRLDRSTMIYQSSATVKGSSKTRDVHGGWSDASGDYGKYLSHLSYANYLNPQQTPLTAWALAFAAERIPNKVKSATADANFALDEAVYGADFLIRMLDETGFFYMTVFNGWSASDMGWYLCAFSGSNGIMDSKYQTAYRQGGGMAIAALARISTLNKDGDYSSAEYLSAAKKAFAHLETTQTIGGDCAYCDNGDGVENIIDDYTALMAASELYNATKEDSYLAVAQKRAAHLVGRLSTTGYFWSDNDMERPFWHASDAGLPLVALVRYMELEKDKSKISYVKAAVKKHLDWLISVTDRQNNPFGYAKQTFKTGGAIKTGFFIPHDNESNYWWQGENARLGSLAAAAIYTSRAIGYADSTKAFAYAADQVDWILGKNPYDVSFMKGIGKTNPRVYESYTSTTFKGGIANGITGKNVDGSGIVWDNMSAVSELSGSWQYWRWVEQWLPHSTWFMMALATWYDETPIKIAGDPIADKPSEGDKPDDENSENPDDKKDPSSGWEVVGGGKPASINATSVSISRLEISKSSILVVAENSKNFDLKITDINGKVVISKIIRGNEPVEIGMLNKGAYIAMVKGLPAQKFVVR